jgi:di/tricarboxylate transporter
MLTFDLIIVFLVLIFILVVLYKELLGASFTFMLAVIVLGLFDILTPKEILSGFANEQVAVIIMLLLLGDVIRRTNVIEVAFDRFFSGAKSYKGFTGRMVLVVASFSAFLNNTPLVAVMMPYIHSWCKRNNMSPSKFLIPLSYAAILGGNATLIGTSTNLIVSGLVMDSEIIPGLPELQLFDFFLVGFVMTIIGYFYLLFFGYKLLPDKKALTDSYRTNTREYLIEARVRNNSHLIGKTVEEAGLRNLKGLFLAEIQRRSFKVSPVSPDMIIDQDDILVFAGDTEKIVDLLTSDSGLTLTEVGMLTKRKQTEVVEVVVSVNSSLINKSVKDINFRGKYDAAVIAVHRNGERLPGKIGSIILKAGDVLLVFGGKDFGSRTSGTMDFYFISKVKGVNKIEGYKTAVLIGGLVSAIVLSAFHVISLFMGLIVMLMVSIILKITTAKDLPKSIDYNLGMIIVMSLALGTAMDKSGAALLIANVIISIFLPLGQVGLLFGIYLITTLLAAYITNKAAVGIIFPIALTMAANLDLNPMPFILTTAYASAANFMTPIGYQTNLMVYGPGAYSFKDFFKIGTPLTFIYMVVTVALLSLIYF